jgi:hypothetical protein
MPDSLREEVEAFFDAFVRAFDSFDGQQVARLFLAPYLAMHTASSVECFATPAEIAAYFQRVLDRYLETGCRNCRYAELEVVAMGAQCALGTVTWELCAGDGSVLSSWRESYNLARQGGELRVFATIDHSH